MKARTWVLVEEAPGEFAVLRNGRQLVCELGERAALRYVRKRMAEGDRVQREDRTGHRRPVSLPN